MVCANGVCASDVMSRNVKIASGSILLRVLADDVTESSLIAEIPALNLDNDDLDGNGMRETFMNFG